MATILYKSPRQTEIKPNPAPDAELQARCRSIIDNIRWHRRMEIVARVLTVLLVALTLLNI